MFRIPLGGTVSICVQQVQSAASAFETNAPRRLALNYEQIFKLKMSQKL